MITLQLPRFPVEDDKDGAIQLSFDLIANGVSLLQSDFAKSLAEAIAKIRLPIGATNQIAYFKATNTVGGSANLTFDGNEVDIGDATIGGILRLNGKTGSSNNYFFDLGSTAGTLDIRVNSAAERFLSLVNTGAGVLSLIIDGNFIFSQTETLFRGATSDGTDNQRLTITPGGAAGDGRGPRILMGANEHSDTGKIEYRVGDVTGGIHDMVMRDDQAGAFKLRQAANAYITVDTTNGSELVTIGAATIVTPLAGSKAVTLYADTSGTLSRGPQLVYKKAASTTVTGTTSETTLLDSGINSNVIAANGASAGTMIEFEFWGFYSNSMGQTIRLKFKIGSTTVLDITSIGAPSTNKQVRFRGHILFQTAGVMGTVFAQAEAFFAGDTLLPVVNTTSSTIDTTAAQTLDATAQHSSAVTPSITITNGWIRIS